MPRPQHEFWIATAKEALTTNLRVDELKRLAGLLATSPPTRKAELVALSRHAAF